MSIRANFSAGWAISLRNWLVGFARIIFVLYVLGNLNFKIASWLSLAVLPERLSHHAVLFQFVCRAALSLILILFVFRASFRRGLASKSTLLIFGAGLGLCCTAAQVGAAIGMGAETTSSWNISAFQLGYLVAFSFSAAITEEILCRFVILGEGRKLFGTPVAFALQVVIFVYIHIESLIKGGANAYLIGSAAIALGAFFLYTESILAAWAFHFAYNVAVVIFFGGRFDGVQIYPFLISDNYSKLFSVQGGVVFNVILGCALFGLVVKRRSNASDHLTKNINGLANSMD